MAPPLTAPEQARVEQVAARLRGELSALVAAFPAAAQSSTGMSRLLGVNRTVGHRLLSAVRSGGDDLEFLARLPGVEGLRRCLAHAREGPIAADEAVLASADAAIDAFHDLIRAVAGSHAKLIARLHATRTAPGRAALGAAEHPSRRLELRRSVYEAMAAAIGRTTRVRATISLMRPVPDAPDLVEYAHVRAYVGVTATPHALPLVLGTGIRHAGDEGGESSMAEFHSLDGTPLQGRIASALLPRFSTQPLPPVTTRGRSGAFSQVIDFPALAAEGRERNVVLAYRVPRVGQLPPTQSPAIYCEVVGVSEPAQRMLADVYLHRSLTAGCTPSMSLFLGHRQVECDLTDRWFERLSGSPPLTLLGSGVSNAWTEAYDWHAALTEHVFATLGWSPSDFEGFRCDEPYPQWGCDYVMAFDYRREQPA